MARPDKPYRVYKTGRTIRRGQLRTRPSTRPDGGNGQAPGTARPKRPRRRWGWGRRIGVTLGVLFLLFVVWALLSFLSFRSGVAKANKRVGFATRAALDDQGSLLLSSPTDVLLLTTPTRTRARTTSTRTR